MLDVRPIAVMHPSSLYNNACSKAIVCITFILVFAFTICDSTRNAR
jgi:hypothetical protein